ncbi:S-adenosyl-L-methionine-dependent methyltransferase [Kalaharituber pfeilii]|nr:S-adenosyl-L-methionine-dependent methyltransferase [Kalaharituber pfeilii]
MNLKGEYILPNDEIEQERLDLMHHIWRIVTGTLHLAPIENPERILDLGTGTGIWAIDMADQYPDAQIIANDLSPIQPKNVPPNLTFEIDDCESLWPYSRPFDLIHARTLAGAIRDWPALYAQAFEHLKPGGWMEVSDFRQKTYCVGGHKPGAACVQLAHLWNKAVTSLGKHSNPAALHKQWMIDAGFINVQEKIVHLPQNPWPADKREKELGAYVMYFILESIPSYGTAALTRILGMQRVEAEALLASARRDVQDTSNKFYSIVHFVIGQKPPASTSDGPLAS